MDYAALLNSAITFAVVMGIFLLFDLFAKTRRVRGKSWKFWVGIFSVYMLVTYLLRFLF